MGARPLDGRGAACASRLRRRCSRRVLWRAAALALCRDWAALGMLRVPAIDEVQATSLCGLLEPSEQAARPSTLLREFCSEVWSPDVI